MYLISTATKKIVHLNKRIRATPGGTSAGKTIAWLQYLITRAQTDKVSTTTSVVSESFPHLRRGAMKDFLSIMTEHHYFVRSRWNKTDSTYTFESGSKIEFFSTDQASKVRGPRRERLFINEANNIDYETFEQLEIRTSEFIALDWNPTNEFWYYSELQGQRDDIDECVLTYKDNEGLLPEIVRSIEMRKNRKGWWQVYGLGLLGEVEGKIYKGWKILGEVPQNARLIGAGLDFGYSNDPTAIVAIYYYNGGYIFDEICFQKGMSNKMIADTLTTIGEILVIADSAEPKSIDEIKSYGINIQPAFKGPDSINNGIQTVQNETCYMTSHSINLIKEYRNYLWETDKNGKILNVPEGIYDHSMDALRYMMSNIIKPKKKGFYVHRPNKNNTPTVGSIKKLGGSGYVKPRFKF